MLITCKTCISIITRFIYGICYKIHISIVIIYFQTVPSNGVNLDLILKKVENDGNDVLFESDLIFNGVCVRWKGKINKQTLSGTGYFEFDSDRAETEAKKSSESLKPYRQRIENIRNLISR